MPVSLHFKLKPRWVTAARRDTAHTLQSRYPHAFIRALIHSSSHICTLTYMWCSKGHTFRAGQCDNASDLDKQLVVKVAGYKSGAGRDSLVSTGSSYLQSVSQGKWIKALLLCVCMSNILYDYIICYMLCIFTYMWKSCTQNVSESRLMLCSLWFMATISDTRGAFLQYVQYLFMLT